MSFRLNLTEEARFSAALGARESVRVYVRPEPAPKPRKRFGVLASPIFAARLRAVIGSSQH